MKTGWEKKVTIAIWLIIFTLDLFRILFYGDLRLSIGNPDTPSYIRSSRNDLFSWQIFAGERMFSTNLLYKLAVGDADCPLTSFSMPGIGQETKRKLQPCFDLIVVFQNLLSVISWSFLAYTAARWVRHPLSKITLISLVLIFGFTPQVAEWDSNLGPESITVSVFILLLAFLLQIAHRFIYNRDRFYSQSNLILIFASLIVYVFWIFIRDAHLYTIGITLLLLLPLLLDSEHREKKIFPVICLLLMGVFVLGYKSAKDSLRATYYPVTNSFYFYIAPYPARLQFFQQRGMPELDSPGLQRWMDDHLAGTFGKFLLNHPGFVLSTLVEYRDYFSSDYLQPYYKIAGSQIHEFLILLGEFVHPESLAIFLIDFIIILGLTLAAVRLRQRETYALAWLGSWFILCSAVTLFITFFGDVAGTRRHIYPSVEMFRLFLWIYLCIMLDTYIIFSSYHEEIKELPA